MKLLVSSNDKLFIVDTTISSSVPIGAIEYKLLSLIILKSNVFGIDIFGNLWKFNIDFSSNKLTSARIEMGLPSDKLGGFPTWLTIHKDAIIAGGNGVDNVSIYDIKIKTKHGVETIHSEGKNTQRGYKYMLDKILNMSSIKRISNSISSVRIISATITQNATYYLATLLKHPDNSETQLYFLISNENKSIQCSRLRDLPGEPIAINSYEDNILCFFQTYNGILYGKLTITHGLVTKQPNLIQLDYPIDTVDILS